MEAEAREVAAELGLDDRWLNTEADWFTGIMLDGWKDRREFIDRFGPLAVFAVGRRDLIALKFYAHREQDVEDLDYLGVTKEEARAVRSHLSACTKKGFSEEQLQPALDFLDAYMGF